MTHQGDSQHTGEISPLAEDVSRREFLRLGGLTLGGVALAGAFGGTSLAGTFARTNVGAGRTPLNDKLVGISTPINIQILAEFFQTMRNQAALPGNREKIIVRNSDGDDSKQQNQVQTMVKVGADAIAGFVAPTSGWEILTKQITGKGIGMFCHSASPVRYMTQNVGLDQFAAGYGLGTYAASWLQKNTGGKGQVGILAILNDPQLRLRSDGMKAALQKFAPSAKIVGEVAAQKQDEGASGAANLLQANPNLAVILSSGDDPGLGALTAATEAGKTNPAQFFLGSCDGTDAVLKEMAKKGIYQATWTFLFPYSATQFQRDIEKFLRGQKVPPTRIMQGVLVTAANLAQQKQLAANPLAPANQWVYKRRMKYSNYQLKTGEPFANAFK